MKRQILVGIALLALPSLTFAEPEPAPASTATPTVQFFPYFDAYYALNFNQPAPVTQPSSASTQNAMIPAQQNALHFYDWYHQQLGLNLVELEMKAKKQEVSLLADFDFGEQADISAQSPLPQAVGGLAPSTVDDISKHLGQAVLSYSPSAVPGLLLEAGKMYCHLGLETPKAKDNFNYSRSLQFVLAGPIWNTGFHAGYNVIPEHFTAGVYLYQGWNTLFENNNSGTYGVQLRWTPTKAVAWTYNYLGGPEQARNNSNWKQVHETNVTWAASELLSLGVDLSIGSEQNAALLNGSSANAYWGGAELLAKVQITKRYSIAPRAELFRDSAGYVAGGDPQTLSTWTLTQSYQLADGFETRLEVRCDTSTSASRFQTSGGTSGTQTEALLGLLFQI